MPGSTSLRPIISSFRLPAQFDAHHHAGTCFYLEPEDSCLIYRRSLPIKLIHHPTMVQGTPCAPHSWVCGSAPHPRADVSMVVWLPTQDCPPSVQLLDQQDVCHLSTAQHNKISAGHVQKYLIGPSPAYNQVPVLTHCDITGHTPT
jgi:hypothetical protein